jgi:hypothetical protein
VAAYSLRDLGDHCRCRTILRGNAGYNRGQTENLGEFRQSEDTLSQSILRNCFGQFDNPALKVYEQDDSVIRINP